MARRMRRGGSRQPGKKDEEERSKKSEREREREQNRVSDCCRDLMLVGGRICGENPAFQLKEPNGFPL